jgi:HlyD family secretion protein
VTRRPVLHSRWLYAVLVLGVIALVALTSRRGAAPDVPTATITRGEYVEYVELRCDVRAAKSVQLTAPMQAGDLQIIHLAKNGATVIPGDVVVEFDGTMLKRTVQEKQSELRQAASEIEQARGQGRLADEQNRTAMLKAQYDVEREKLEVGQRDVVARLDYEKAKLALADAEQRLKEAGEKTRADRAASDAALAASLRKREKVQADLARAERSLVALVIKAPSPGIVSLMPNYRAGNFMGGEQEFREGDRAWAGAGIVELPDPTTLRLEARLDEADRGRIKPGQHATVRVDALPDREFKGSVGDISLLARVDFSSGWPPPRNFDLQLKLDDRDARLKPGMSATARVAVGSLPGVLLAPAGAVFVVDGRPTVYRVGRHTLEPRVITVLKRGRDQVAISGGISAGDRVSLQRPSETEAKKAS